MSRKRSTPMTESVLGPVYAAVGLTESTLAALRDLGHDRPEGAQSEQLNGLARLRQDAEDVVRGATRVPSTAVEEAKSLYAGFMARGRATLTSAVPTVVSSSERRGRSEAERSEAARARREARRLARQAETSVARGRDLAQKVAGDAGQAVERTVAAVRSETTQFVQAVAQGTGGDSPAGRRAVRRRSAVVDTAMSATAPTDRGVSAGTDSGVSAGVEAAAATRARRVARARAAAAAPSAATSTVARAAARERRAERGERTPMEQAAVRRATIAGAMAASTEIVED